jgi:hypothetical protein
MLENEYVFVNKTEDKLFILGKREKEENKEEKYHNLKQSNRLTKWNIMLRNFNIWLTSSTQLHKRKHLLNL